MRGGHVVDDADAPLQTPEAEALSTVEV
jgi:hypothetical protein